MPLTFTSIHPQLSGLTFGNCRARLVRVIPDAALLATGELMEAKDFGLAEICSIFCNVSTPLTASTNIEFTATRTDGNSWTLQGWETGAAPDAGFAEANADDLSAMRIDLLVIGF